MSCLLLIALPIPILNRAGLVPSVAEDAELRAIAYLGREVPRWSRENHCFSCHHNGDAARALLAATKTELAAPKSALADTLDFLASPDRWEKNGVNAAFSDQRLARIQFASALALAVRVGQIKDCDALGRAADLVAKDQARDGSWPIDENAPVGSPATYGPALATAMAIRIFRQTDRKRHEKTLANAVRWMRSRRLLNMQDAASLLLAIPDETPSDRISRRKAVDFLRRGQNEDGGWGPFLRSSSEPFDTAVALIALSPRPRSPDVDRLICRGRTYLVTSQNADGSWPETTRPAGGMSYSQRLSTAGWATLALLATRPSAPAKADRKPGP